MPIFIYKAINKKGQIIHGTINSLQKDCIEMLLAREGLTLIRLESKSYLHRLQKNIIDLQNFFFQLSHLLQQKITLKDALNIISMTMESRLAKKILMAIINDIQQGISFSDALLKYPHIFNSFVVGSLKSSENTGNLEKNCKMLCEFFKRQNLIQKQHQKAIFYPFCVFFTLFIFLTMILRVLIPHIRNFLEETDTLSISQKLLFSLSNLSLHSPFSYFITFIILIVSFYILWEYFVFSRNYSRNSNYEGILWLNTLAILLQSGVILKDALILSQQQIKKSSFKKEIEKVTQKVMQGASFCQTLQEVNTIPPSTAKFAEIGESSGSLGLLLTQNAQFEMQKFIEKTYQKISFIQPSLLIILGIILLWIVFTVFLPLYNKLSFI